jgi:hypothetical protein
MRLINANEIEYERDANGNLVVRSESIAKMSSYTVNANTIDRFEATHALEDFLKQTDAAEAYPGIIKAIKDVVLSMNPVKVEKITWGEL